MQSSHSSNLLFPDCYFAYRIHFVCGFIYYFHNLWKHKVFSQSRAQNKKTLHYQSRNYTFHFAGYAQTTFNFQKDTKGEVSGDYLTAQEVEGAGLVVLAGAGAAAEARSQEVAVRPVTCGMCPGGACKELCAQVRCSSSCSSTPLVHTGQGSGVEYKNDKLPACMILPLIDLFLHPILLPLILMSWTSVHLSGLAHTLYCPHCMEGPCGPLMRWVWGTVKS